MTRTALLATVAAAGLLVAGCAGTAVERGPSTTDIIEGSDYLARRPVTSPSGFQAAAQARARDLIAQPLTLATALEIAMLNTPELQRVYQGYQIYTPRFIADLATAREEAGANEGAEWTALRVAWPALKATVRRNDRTVSSYAVADEYVETAQAFVDTAAHVRTAYYTAVAAQQIEGMMRQVVSALRAEAELANEQYRAGTASRREQAERHLAYAAALKEHARAKQEVVEAREALNRDLGLWGDTTGWTLPERLPDLPAAAPGFEGLEDHALKHRLDLLGMRRAGGAWTEAVAVRSKVRETYANLRTAYETAKYQRDVVLPLTQTALAEAQREYNGMLIGTYDLLAATREQIEAGRDYVETLRDYWIAEAELAHAVGGRLPRRTELVQQENS